MTIVNSLEEFCDCFNENSRCNTCGGELVPPFLMYCAGGSGLFLCGQCVLHVRNGLTADLIQLSAIVELRQVFDGKTLVRRDTAQINADGKERKLRPKPPGVIELFPRSDDGGAA